MRESLSGHRRRRAVVLTVTGFVVVLLVLWLALVGDDRPAGGDRAAGRELRVPPSSAAGVLPDPPVAIPNPIPADDDSAVADRGPRLPPLPDTDDPDTYAAAVVEVLFGMDYTNHGPADYEAFFEAALWDELTDEARTGVAATMALRIPRPDMWAQMRSVEQTSEFEVELVWEPRAQAQLDADPGVPDGVVIRNVTGTQTETWLAADGQQQTSGRPVTVSLAVVCPPAASPCALGGIFPNVES